MVMLGTLVLLLVIPTATFIAVALSSGLSMSDTLNALATRFSAKRVNIAMSTALGLFPWLLLLAFLGIRRLLKLPPSKSTTYAAVGSVPAILIALFVNLEYWPTFLPQQTYAGFPHGLEFVIGPGVFAPIGLLIAIIMAWLATRMRK